MRKETNNISKLPFYPYKNFKITKLLKKKKAFFFLVAVDMLGTDRNARNWPIQPIFELVLNVEVSVPMHVY